MKVVNDKNESIKENNILMTQITDFLSIKNDLDTSLVIKDTLIDRKESNFLIAKEETNLSLIRKEEFRIPVVTEELIIPVITEKELKIPKITGNSVDTEELNLNPFISQENMNPSLPVSNEEFNMSSSYKVENIAYLNSNAQHFPTSIALISFKGVETSYDPMKSFHWRLAANPLITYWKLVKRFFPSKIFNIGCILLKENEKVGIKLIQEAAENEYGKAQLYLGGAYIEGRIFERDYKKSFEWILRSARNNNIEAEFYLGCMYKFGIGCEKDYNKSLCWFIKSAKHNHSEAQFFLRYLYRFGQVVQLTQKDALNWFIISAANGQVNAQYILGQIYEIGLLGAKVNGLISLVWYIESAKQGHSLARYRFSKITQFEINSQIKSQQFTKNFFLN
ncbi:12143_t:CDS:2 [Funneliformis mosseae]|uniref:12143_t:CDS:1 n=1 Tax=Funneliformis mosseae TaxID=27381 RepID=A0A9N9FXJ9_FUNMO|nr:12143_t:CDS:2 [Funneliformis mosseae]